MISWLPAASLLVACSQNPAQELDRLCLERFPEGEPGAAVLVMKGDEVLFDKGYGVADLETGAGIGGDTFFNIASISKQFTAVAILQLVQEGKLSLEDPVAKFYPEFRAPFWQDVKIKHLLSHSSGIPDARGYLTREQKVQGDEALALEYMPGLQALQFQPGSAYEYMNPTFVLCGDLVEKLSGMPFTEYMARNVFEPAGMEKTLYFDRDHQELIPSMAHGYRFGDGQWYEYDFGEETFFATRPDGGIYTSTHEFAKWEKALRKGTVLPKEAVELAHTPQILISGSPWSDYQNRPNTWYGYGWFIEPATDSTQKVVYHTGDNGGFKAMAARYPESEALVLIFANRDDWDRYGFLQEIEKIFGL